VTDLWRIVCDGARPRATLTVPAQDSCLPMTAILTGAESTAGHIKRALGHCPPRRLGLLLDNGEPWVRGLLAIWRLGATAVPLPLPVAFAGPAAYTAQVRGITQDVGLDAILVDASATGRGALRGTGPPLIDITDPADADPPSPARAADAAVIQYTSGSTSRPKGVVLSHDNVAAGIDMLWRATGSTEDDSLGLWLPLYHDMGLFSLVSALAHGLPVSLWKPREFIRRPIEWLQQFAASRATITAAPNFFYDMLADAATPGVPGDLDLSAWRIAINGAEPVRRPTLTAFTRAFGSCGLRPGLLRPAYGLAEATLLVAITPPGRQPRSIEVDRSGIEPGGRIRLADRGDPSSRTIVSAGPPVPPVQLRVSDEQGGKLPEGMVGEVQITGPPVTAGYHGLDRADQPFTADGWLRTGDLAFLWDDDVYIVGRTKDLIIVRGVNYYPEDVEEIVRATPEVTGRNAAFAWADDAGERIVVLWETQLGGSAVAAVSGLIRRRLYECLGLGSAEVVAVPARTIMFTSSGKVKRAETREAWRQKYVVGRFPARS
jgi:fatty-acyl-CoA synthase